MDDQQSRMDGRVPLSCAGGRAMVQGQRGETGAQLVGVSNPVSSSKAERD